MTTTEPTPYNPLFDLTTYSVPEVVSLVVMMYRWFGAKPSTLES